jgi:hypothetical protein
VSWQAGRVLFPTDGLVIVLDNGTDLYDTIGYAPRLRDPNAQTWFWTNQSNATVTSVAGGIYLDTGTSTGPAQNLNIRRKSAPATPYHIVTMWFPKFFTSQYEIAGLCFLESATGKVVTWDYRAPGTAATEYHVGHYSSPTVLTADAYTSPNAGYIAPTGEQWMRIADDGTTLTFDISTDGKEWMNLYSEARGSYFTTAPDRVGFHVNPYNQAFGMTLLNWQETA